MTPLRHLLIAAVVATVSACGGEPSSSTILSTDAIANGQTTCTYTYSAWGACQPDYVQYRTVISESPKRCVGTPDLTQPCHPISVTRFLDFDPGAGDFASLTYISTDASMLYIITDWENAFDVSQYLFWTQRTFIMSPPSGQGYGQLEYNLFSDGTASYPSTAYYSLSDGKQRVVEQIALRGSHIDLYEMWGTWSFQVWIPQWYLAEQSQNIASIEFGP